MYGCTMQTSFKREIGMCANYRAPRYKEIVDAIRRLAEMPFQEWPEEIYMDYAAPLVRAGDDGKP